MLTMRLLSQRIRSTPNSKKIIRQPSLFQHYALIGAQRAGHLPAGGKDDVYHRRHRDVSRNRLRAVTKVTKFETIIATEQFAAESGFSEGDELWAVQRVRYLDGKALILDINYFLKEFVPGLTEEIASHSIYDFIENVLGMQIITSKRRITMEHATARDEKLLDMDGYDCVAVVVNQTFNSDGMLFEYTQSRHQPDYFCFQDIATRKK